MRQKGMIMANIRNLWAEVTTDDTDKQRVNIEKAMRYIYSVFISLGGIIAIDLYTRPDSWLLKVFGVLVSVCLVIVDVLWAWATHHSAHGKQRYAAWVFWGGSLLIFAMNIISDFTYHLGRPLGFLENWYFLGSISTVVWASFGIAIFLMFSPEQAVNDVRQAAHHKATQALMKGLEHPDQETLDAFNQPIVSAARVLSERAASSVAGQATQVRNNRNNGNGGSSPS